MRRESQNSGGGEEASQTVPNRLDAECRKTVVWEPTCAFYGTPDSAHHFIVGFCAERPPFGQPTPSALLHFYATSGNTRCWSGVIDPADKRIKLSSFLASVIEQGIAGGHVKVWPDQVYLTSRNTLSDLTAFRDFASLRTQFDSLKGAYVSIRRPLKMSLWDRNHHSHPVKVVLRDISLLLPSGTSSLSDLEALVGDDISEVSHDAIGIMGALLNHNPIQYAKSVSCDPMSSVQYCLRILDLNREVTGEVEIPATLSSIGVNHLLKTWNLQGFDKQLIMGCETVTEDNWDARFHQKRKKKNQVPTKDRNDYEHTATESYHGGRNEQYMFGAGEVGVWSDFDLCGAYTTAMAIIGMPKWSQIRQTRDLGEFQPEVLGYARVKFRFPVDCRFPCLPVRAASGLVFPLSGETYCCSPEIYLAQKMGAVVDVVLGIILPTDGEPHPFEDFMIDCTKRRKSFAKGSLYERLWKELGNGIYGKTAQGLKDKRCFNSRSGDNQRLPTSQITNPYFAAFVTSFVRACLSEILSCLPSTVVVCNATTDGFLSTATDEQVKDAISGPICTLFSRARHRICGNSTVLEAKHRVAQPLGWRNRGQATLVPLPDESILLAKAGIKPPVDGIVQQNEWIVNQFINRTSDSKITYTSPPSFRDVWLNGDDSVLEVHERRIPMEFDWKRRPGCSSMRSIRGVNHLYFDTVPWRSVEEFQACRDAWEQYTNQSPTVLKTEADLGNFNEYRALTFVGKGIKKPRKNPSVKVAKMMFLRAYVNSVRGLDSRTMSYSKLANLLTANGYPTKKEDVENAKRLKSRLVSPEMPRTAVADKFVEFVKSQFPNFESEWLFKNG